jgi:hypothetical protein
LLLVFTALALYTYNGHRIESDKLFAISSRPVNNSPYFRFLKDPDFGLFSFFFTANARMVLSSQIAVHKYRSKWHTFSSDFLVKKFNIGPWLTGSSAGEHYDAEDHAEARGRRVVREHRRAGAPAHEA